MIALSIVCSALCAPPAKPAAELAAYEVVKAKVGRDAPSLVKLALWCEAKGLDAQREAPGQAVLADPTNALPAGSSAWSRSAAVDDAREGRRGDEVRRRLAAKLAKYEERRERIEAELAPRGGGPAEAGVDRRRPRPRRGRERREAIRRELAPDHARLGLWCEANGLKDEALAHFHYAVLLDPYRESTWKHLGYVRRDDRWMTHAQAVAAEKEETARRRADRRWDPLLRKSARARRPGQARRRPPRLDAVDDPLAVPAIVRILGDGPTADVAVRMLAHFDTPESTLQIAELAVVSPSARARARRSALRGRDPRDYAGTLVELIRSAIKLHVQPVGGPGLPGLMIVETPRVKMIRTYDAPAAFRPEELIGGFFGFDDDGLPVAATAGQVQRQER